MFTVSRQFLFRDFTFLITDHQEKTQEWKNTFSFTNKAELSTFDSKKEVILLISA